MFECPLGNHKVLIRISTLMSAGGENHQKTYNYKSSYKKGEYFLVIVCNHDKTKMLIISRFSIGKALFFQDIFSHLPLQNVVSLRLL